jgi:broad specificity phosphatase PhoE
MSNGSNGDTPKGNAPNRDTDRFEAPMYLARFRERHAPVSDNGLADLDDGAPLYLKRFRDRAARPTPDADVPLWQRAELGTQQALTEDNRNKEISAPASSARQLLNDVYLIRHGETQGYSTDSGLTPQGAWQAHTYGRTLARRMTSGETIVFRHAATNRARETAEQIHRGLLDGTVQYEKVLTIVEPEPAAEFCNFRFAAPDGLKDVTAAFRQYNTLLEGFERTAVGDRPLWLVEMDRFWRTQTGGGDPIAHWLTIPLMHFEPPSMAVRRLWAGISRLSAEFPGARVAIATHSGCIRAFAVSALGYDPGEPYNTEHVRVKLLGDTDWSRGGRDAMVAYRNRVQEVKVPDIGRLPTWSVHDDWQGITPASTAQV